MVRPAQTVRSERTREALRRAALLRFLDQGVQGTSAEQIAADAGVSLRTFYRHFASKHDLLFADYDAGLHWFRSALASRPSGEPILESVKSAIFAFPYDVEVVTQIAVAAGRRTRSRPDHPAHPSCRGGFCGGDRRASATAPKRRSPPDGGHGTRVHRPPPFRRMEFWMTSEERSLAELASMCRDGAAGSARGRTVLSLLTKLCGGDSVLRMTDYDAIVIGAGHNGLTAAVLLQTAQDFARCASSPSSMRAEWRPPWNFSTATSSRSPARCS